MEVALLTPVAISVKTFLHSSCRTYQSRIHMLELVYSDHRQ